MGISLGGLAATWMGGGSQAAMSIGQRNWQKRDQARQMSFQERMSSTAYQRSMADMRAAGLNPILAYQQGGASTPSGSSANARAPDLQNIVTTAMQAKQFSKQQEVMDADIELKHSAADFNSAKAMEADASSMRQAAQTDLHITELQTAKLKLEQRRTTGDSALGRLINSILRMGKFTHEHLKALSGLSENPSSSGAAAKRLLDSLTPKREPKTHGFTRRTKSGKYTNKKAIRKSAKDVHERGR